MAEESQETILHILIVALSLEAIAVGCTRSWLLDYSGHEGAIIETTRTPCLFNPFQLTLDEKVNYINIGFL